MRPEYVVDHSPGWEWFLGVLHRAAGWDEDALISFSVASMALVVLCFPLIWVRHPEAWLAAVLAQMIAIPDTDEPLGPRPSVSVDRGHPDGDCSFRGPERARPQPSLVESGGDLSWVHAFGLDAWGVVSLGSAVRGLFPGPTLAGRPLAGGLLDGGNDRGRAADGPAAGLS